VVLQNQPENVRADLTGQEVPYEIICDPGQAVYWRFSVEPAPDRESRQPADPAGREKRKAKLLFIVAGDGKVLYTHYAKNSIDMPAVDEVLELLKQ
jgi:hypothetical protein